MNSHNDLSPRAQAVLVCLRKGPRTTGHIADSLADTFRSDTTCMIESLIHLKLIQPSSGSTVWHLTTYCLTSEGIAWLESRNLREEPY